LDLISANSVLNTLTVLTNSGLGLFTTNSTPAVGTGLFRSRRRISTEMAQWIWSAQIATVVMETL